MMKANAITALLLATGILLSGCGEGSSNDTDNADSTNSNETSNSSNETGNSGTISPPSPVTPNGTLVPDGARQLAAQCFQCHGTDGRSRTGIDSLLGEGENELLSEMLEMKHSTRNDLMHYQAKGYSEAQIRAIAAYIASLGGTSGGDSDD